MSAHGSATRRFSVVTVKTSGTEVVFGTYATRSEAELIVEKLAAIGCAARCERALATDYSGRTRGQ